MGGRELAILLVGHFGKRAQHPRVRGMLQCVVPASATLLVLASIPIGREALNGWLTIGITVAALPLLISKRINTVWIIAGAAALSLTGTAIGVAQLRHHQPRGTLVQGEHDQHEVSYAERNQRD